jgi:hypothetical protein
MGNSVQGGEEAPFKVEAGYKAEFGTIQLDADGMISHTLWQYIVAGAVVNGNDSALKLRDALRGQLKENNIPYNVLYVYSYQGNSGYAGWNVLPDGKGWQTATVEYQGWKYRASIAF